MSKKYFIALAAAIGTAKAIDPGSKGVQYIQERVENLCVADNPNFDVDRFRQAINNLVEADELEQIKRRD